MPVDYNQTVNLPKTDFPMRAGLPKREPEMLQRFQDAHVYENLMDRNAGKPAFILHDGPPYANGDIHIGTAMNKILKDFIVRYKNMTGFYAPYVPGWDTHGLPIESAILKNSKVKREDMTIPEFRDKCRDFALMYMNRQREEFMRLGGIGDWQHPYLTLEPQVEAKQIEVFGAMAEKGYIYKGLKPVYWCPTDETALAEAEIEYNDDPCESIYVKFPVHDDGGKLGAFGNLGKLYFVIWTTTTWTLPGNLAICLGADYDYDLVRVPNGEVYIMAHELAAQVLKLAGISDFEVLGTMKGSDFEFMTAWHPFIDRESIILNGDHVTLDAGTGCVHTAPGFGMDDFLICQHYDRERGTHIGVTVPVSAKGVMTAEAGPCAGQYYSKANETILALLREQGFLLASERIVHPYPHCWRCKKPIIYRATEQWFASVDAIKDAAVSACDGVWWNPEWGKERMISMIRERADWCISRQRQWGVPIPIFYCAKCGKEHIDQASIRAVSDLFRLEGSNAWFSRPAGEILPEGTVCKHCGGTEFTKESDIMDVWFDSGSTQTSVLQQRPELRFPADLYLEGGDQYRGWFQSSLLTSIAANGQAPFRQIVTHGWTVDGEGKAMHKSLGNAVSPDEIIKDYGADILRLWVSSADYRQDMRISKEILKQLSDAYLKIRNTCRYILGNLAGFNPDDQVPLSDMTALDRFALSRLNALTQKVRAAYDVYEFHTVYRSVYNFCVVDLSNLYLDILKDRLYCEAQGSRARRSAQTAIYRILDGLVRMLAPLLAFTSEEIWAAMPHHEGVEPQSVLFNDMPSFDPSLALSDAENARWDALLALRTDVNKALEAARAAKTIGKSLEAEVTLAFTDEAAARFEAIRDFPLTDLLIVSAVHVADRTDGMAGEDFPGLTVHVSPSQAPKCIRCWNHRHDVGTDAAHPELCARCAGVVRSL